MAFALSGTPVSANTKAGATTFTLTTGASGWEAPNKLVVVVVACDNTSTTDTTTKDNIVGVTDSKGNTYANAAACTNGQALAQGGATVAVFYSIIGTTLNSSTITITNTTGGYARAAAAAAFSFPGGSLNLGFSTQVQDAGVDPSIVISGKASKEYLWIGGVADENNATIAAPSGFTLGASNTTTGSGAAANMAVQLAYDISVSTGKTYAPAVIGDCAALLGFFEELAITVPVTMTGMTAAVGQAAVQTKANVSVTSPGMTADVGQVAVVGAATVPLTAPSAITASVGTVTAVVPLTIRGYAVGGPFGAGYYVETANRDYAVWPAYVSETLGAPPAPPTLVPVTMTGMTADVGQVAVTGKAIAPVTETGMVATVGQATVSAKADVTTTSPAMSAATGQAAVSAKATVPVTAVPGSTAATGQLAVTAKANVSPASPTMTAAVGQPTVTAKGNASVTVGGMAAAIGQVSVSTISVIVVPVTMTGMTANVGQVTIDTAAGGIIKANVFGQPRMFATGVI